MMTVDNDVYCNKYEQLTRSMFIHKQLGAEDTRYTTVSTDSRTTTNSSSLLTGSARRATLLQQAAAAAAANFRSIHSTLHLSRRFNPYLPSQKKNQKWNSQKKT